MTRRLLVPEVVQTSATDCGPAALKALFAGYGRYLSYGRLREACQTTVDGTSIDTLELMGNALGLELEQRMLSPELVLLGSSRALPAIALVQLPDDATHFIVIWRALGPYVQVMDPAAGRLWIRRAQLLDSLYRHEQRVPLAVWTAWMQSDAFEAGLAARQRGLGIRPHAWTDRAHLDASLRLAQALVERGSLRRGRDAAALLALCADHRDEIPDEYWSVRPDPDDEPTVRARGAVLLVATGRPADPADPAVALLASLEAIRSEPPPALWQPVWQSLRESGIPVQVAIGAALLAAAAGVVLEALLFRGLLEIGQRLPRAGDRAAAVALVVLVAGALLVLEWAAASGMFRLGRHLDVRFRAAFLRKVPRLPDRYFQSRLISDMASRAHALQLLRELPAVAGLAGSLAGTLLFTAGAIAWLYPGAALPAVAAAVAAVAVPLLFRRPLLERDLRVRESGAALSRFHLDALLGACAIQAHAAEPALMHAHARQLDGWVAAGLRRQALIVAAEAIQSALSIACVVWLIVGQAAAGWHAGLLLLTFWAVSIPAIGAELATVLWSLPLLRNTILRCLEPLGSPELDVGAAAPPDAPSAGVSVDIDDVTVLAGGHTVLDRVTLRIAPGEHVAIVGPSGSGKSSLVGLLLGWHEPAEGRLLVDRQPLSSAARAALRQTTAWIDPQVHLFRTSVFENVRFGQNDAAGDTAAEAGDAALVDLLRRLPDGLQTLVGDRGGALSAGEGQRIRIARALARRDARLAVLDEPARGLDRDRRRQLLADARRHFRTATVLAITHDLSDTLDFDRVVVLDSGRILEHGTPAVLAADPMSRYASLLAEERAVRQDVWSHPRWRRLRMEKGTLREAAEERTWTLV